MPVYEYVCKSCDHEFEREQRITDDPVKACPRCGARKAKRLISRTSFVLKGGGWYSDLYSGGTPTKKDGASDGTGDAAAESKGSGGDDKSAGESAAKPKPGSKDKTKDKTKSKPGSDGSGKATKAAAA